jgi:hypothetical protein
MEHPAPSGAGKFGELADIVGTCTTLERRAVELL